MDSASTETAQCAGFPADTYDRYVLGLLDATERAHVDRQIEQQCPTCIGGVQRSMNLWLVFANSLEHVEPAADFRARLVRIAELSNRVLTVPKRNKRVREPAILISSLVVIGLILTALLVFTWVAGRRSVHIDDLRAGATMSRLQTELAETTVKLDQQTDRNKALEEQGSAHSLGHSASNMQKLQEQLSAAQAEAQQYKAEIARTKEKTIDNSTLVSALSSPGVKLMTFKNGEATSSTAYAFVVENSKVLFVASNLPITTGQPFQYQLWLVRKEEPHFVSAGVFSVENDRSVVITYDRDTAVISSLAGLLVTQEKLNGNSSPSAIRVLETPGAAAFVPPVANAEKLPE